MEGIMTVRDLIEDLADRDLDQPVMVAVIKYPEEFAIQFRNGEARWTDHDDVECVPVGFDDIQSINGIVHISVELADYSELRHKMGVKGADGG